MDTGGLELNLLKPEKELPKSPGLELIALLARGKRDLQQIRAYGIPLARALEVLRQTPYDAFVEARGNRLVWVGESDLQEFWRRVGEEDFSGAWSLYGSLLPGFSSPLPAFQEWLEAERMNLASALHHLALTLPPEEIRFQSDAELGAPKDRERALMAMLLEGEALLRQGRAKEAVLVLGQALGLQEWGGGGFSGLSLALLAQAQAAWGKPSKARQTAEKALERARDAYTRSRALYALYQATQETPYLEQSRAEAGRANLRLWLEHLSGEPGWASL
ncbi:MAG: hypothetical protein ACOYW9_14120 [Deinococcota bacterium]